VKASTDTDAGAGADTDDGAGLPGCLGDLARAGHLAAAWVLLRERGGTSIYVPATPSCDSALVQLIGLPATQALLDIYGSGSLPVPLASHRSNLKARILRADDTVSNRRLARELGTTEQTVSRIRSLKKRDAATDQRQLFLPFE
jgi:hypothetical protein